jgi:uncharacterized protein YdbL (DUF1318 family)
MRRLRGLALALSVGLAVLGGGMTVAMAQDGLEAAKATGLVGERPDGLVGIVPQSVPPEIRALVERVNAERRERYRDVARSNGTSVDTVQAVAGRRLIERTPAGQYVMSPSGSWVRK